MAQYVSEYPSLTMVTKVIIMYMENPASATAMFCISIVDILSSFMALYLNEAIRTVTFPVKATDDIAAHQIPMKNLSVSEPFMLSISGI